MKKNEMAEIMESLKNLTQRISVLEEKVFTLDKTPEPRGQQEIQESFMEFFIRYNPKKDTDKTLVIMHFLESRRDVEYITIKEISEGFKEVREKSPINISDKLQLLHKKGLIMPGNPANRFKTWIITRTGLNSLEKLENGNKKI